ncbi:MAG: hypothetical protein LUC16_02865 [Coprobacillus sp.]|nr:hypothetical protein [Coprobacillus sp.]
MKKFFHRRKKKNEEVDNAAEQEVVDENSENKKKRFKRNKKSDETGESETKSTKKYTLPVAGNIIIIAVGALFTYFYFSYTELVVFVAVIAIFNYWIYSSRIGKKQTLEEAHSEEFVSLLTYLQIYIVNGINVYQSFQLSLPYLSNWMREKVERLLSDIDSDKTIEPFLTFASNFTDQHYEDILIVLFQMIDQGNESTYMSKFVYLFERLNDESRSMSFEKNKKIIDSASVFPMVGTAVFTICLTFGIISMLGDVISVL